MTTLHHPHGFYCGREEGYLSCEEFIRRTEQDLARYAMRQPLKWRQAMHDLFPLAKKSPTPLRTPGTNNTNPKVEIRESDSLSSPPPA